MEKVTREQAVDTYKKTVRDEPRNAWAVWVLAVHNSLVAQQWIGSDKLPAFAKDVYEAIKAEPVKISMADETK